MAYSLPFAVCLLQINNCLDPFDCYPDGFIGDKPSYNGLFPRVLLSQLLPPKKTDGSANDLLLFHIMTFFTLVGVSIGLLFVLPSVVSAAGLFNFTQCAININTTFTDAFNSSFLVDSSGSFTNNPNNAWGITYGACMTLCGSGWEAFDWYFFSTSVSSWVLPWLALTAQLPYETKDSTTNLLSVLLAVGSPLLITYSLCLTVLNSRWINIRFRALHCRNEEYLGKQVKTMEAARIFLRESQHVPLGINGSPSMIAQLVVLPENRAWWYSLRKEILKSKREWYVIIISVFFHAKLLSAVISYVPDDTQDILTACADYLGQCRCYQCGP